MASTCDCRRSAALGANMSIVSRCMSHLGRQVCERFESTTMAAAITHISQVQERSIMAGSPRHKTGFAEMSLPYCGFWLGKFR